MQDREGFLWIGTQTGLQRYDGKRFKNYVADIRDTAALQSDWISSIFEDSKNRLWFGCDQEGPYTFNRNTGKFYNYNLHASAENTIKGIWNIAEDKHGVIWIAGHDGLYRFNDPTNQFEKYNVKSGVQKNNQTGWLDIDADNNIWFGSKDGMNMYNQKEKKLFDHDNNPLHNPLFDIKESIGIIKVSGNYLWVTCARKLYRYDFLKKTLNKFTFEKSGQKSADPEQQMEVIAGFNCLPDGNVIVALSQRGLAIYEPAKNEFFIIESDNTKSYTYHVTENSFENVCIAQDRAKYIFIGSGKGLSIYSPEKQFFQMHKRNPSTGDLFPSNAASDFLQLDNGSVLISYYHTNGGIVKADSALRFKKQYLVMADGNINNISNQVWNLFRDDNGIIWGPNQHHSILKLNVTTDKIIDENDTVLNGPLIMIKRDAGRIIWMGHWSNGLVKMDLTTGEKKNFDQFLGADSNNKKRVESLLIDGNKIWIGTNQNGLQVFDKKKERFTEAFVVNANDKYSISNNSIKDILAYNDDTIIIATLMGVDIFDKKRKTFKAITVKEGLPNNLVQALMKDNFGNVWIACYTEGLCKMSMNDFSITRYDINDGITDNVFGSKFYKLKNGKILLGVADGFLAFDPSAFTLPVPPVNVRITSVHIFENEVAIDSLIKGNQPLNLSYKENSVRFEFSSFEYWNPGVIKYYYQLDGVDKDWIAADISNTAVYNQLNPGRYTFRVKCANRDGLFCKTVTQFIVIIDPPFWKKWWFIAFVVISAIFLVLAFLKWRIKHIKTSIEAERKLQQKHMEISNMNEQLSKVKLEALRSQMNPHFIFNSLNAIQECILSNKVDAAYRYLAEFSKLQRMVLNNSQKELIPLSAEIEMLQLYLSLESLRFDKSFVYHMDIAGIQDANEIMIPSMITQPLVENAIWHGLHNKEGDKRLEIIYEERNGKIFITIDDDGIGRESAAVIRKQKLGNDQFSSKGTIILQQRLQVLGQQLKAEIELETTDKYDEFGKAGGTKVVISFPSNLETE